MEETTRNESDPYVCFRRREIKTGRKTRRTDAQSLIKLRQLRAEMESARILLEMIAKREKMRKESLLLEHVIFEQKALVREMRETMGVSEDTFAEWTRAAQKVGICDQ
jgi:hypothetical protein